MHNIPNHSQDVMEFHMNLTVKYLKEANDTVIDRDYDQICKWIRSQKWAKALPPNLHLKLDEGIRLEISITC